MIRQLICKFTGFRYNYRATLTYKDNYGRPLFSGTVTFNTTHPKFTDDHRAVKKEISGMLIKAAPKHHLCNGQIDFEPTFYIGFYKPKP